MGPCFIAPMFSFAALSVKHTLKKKAARVQMYNFSYCRRSAPSYTVLQQQYYSTIRQVQCFTGAHQTASGPHSARSPEGGNFWSFTTRRPLCLRPYGGAACALQKVFARPAERGSLQEVAGFPTSSRALFSRRPAAAARHTQAGCFDCMVAERDRLLVSCRAKQAHTSSSATLSSAEAGTLLALKNAHLL